MSKIYLPNVEDNSHEWSVDSANKPGSTRTLRPTAPPSPPPPQPHGNYGEVNRNSVEQWSRLSNNHMSDQQQVLRRSTIFVK